MQGKYSFLFGAVPKLPHGFVPAVIASVVGGILFSHYANSPMKIPTTANGAPAGADKMQMVRDEHEFLVVYLQKHTEARQKSDLAAQEEMLRSRAAEQAVRLVASEAKAAETRALAIAANATTAASERKIAPKKSARVANNVTTGEPLQLVHLASATAQIQPEVQRIAPPSGRIAPAARSQEAVIKTKLRQVAAMIERVPLWVHSVSDWFSGNMPSHRVLQLRTGMS
jgi:hypothetical protein